MNKKFWSAGFLVITKVYAVIASPFRGTNNPLPSRDGNNHFTGMSKTSLTFHTVQCAAYKIFHLLIHGNKSHLMRSSFERFVFIDN